MELCSAIVGRLALSMFVLMGTRDCQKLVVAHDDRRKVAAEGFNDIAVLIPDAAPLERRIG